MNAGICDCFFVELEECLIGSLKSWVPIRKVPVSLRVFLFSFELIGEKNGFSSSSSLNSQEHTNLPDRIFTSQYLPFNKGKAGFKYNSLSENKLMEDEEVVQLEIRSWIYRGLADNRDMLIRALRAVG